MESESPPPPVPPASSDDAAGSAPAAPTLGAFLGVYTPTLLTILGVIMYLRLGWVVGHVGLEQTLLIVVLAHVITMITTLSFSAVATNTRVGVGGAYYIISRSLGRELGGAIGLPLFLSQAFSVTLYAFGLAEALRYFWPAAWPELPMQETAFVIVLAVAALAFRGAAVALKSQVPLMVMIGVSIVALAAGTLTGEQASLPPDVLPPADAIGVDVTFWVAFAVFFPAVTGVMAGLGLSGDLKDPGKSIPRGAIGASITGLLVYLLIPFLLDEAATPELLQNDKLVWTSIAPLGAWLILPGLVGAIFSSAVGSILGAPRTLQALAFDQIAPSVLGRTGKRSQEPVFGLALTTSIALGGVLLGDLNAVAPVVSMFFLTVYGTLNVVAALETLASDPSWRPKIRVPWYVSLVGGLGCFAAMFLINPLASVVAITVEVILWVALTRRARETDWGDARRGMYEALIRWSLVRLAQRPLTARNWRPHVLIFADSVDRRLGLIEFGNWFSQERGVVTVCELIEGDLSEATIDPRKRARELQRRLDEEEIVAFPEVDIVRDVVTGIVDVSQANGIAGLDSNLILLGWPPRVSRLAKFLAVIRNLEKIHKSVVIGRVQYLHSQRSKRRPEIHIWWGGLQRNGDLMLLLAHLLTSNPEWRGARIRVLSIANNEERKRATEENLARLIPRIRIAAETTVMLQEEGRAVPDIIREFSASADVVFLGLAVPKPGEEEAYARRLMAASEGLGTVFYVKNSSLFVGELIGDMDE